MAAKPKPKTDMNNKNILIILVFAALLSCQKETDTSTGGLPMRIVPTIDGATKASMTTVDLQEFDLKLDCPANTHYSFCERITKSGSSWSAGKDLHWKDETTVVTFRAASFSRHTFTADEFENGVDLSVPNCQRSQDRLNSADLLYAPATQIKYEDTSDGALPVNFNHVLAKVNFVISLGEQFYQNGYGIQTNPVTDILIKGVDLGFHFTPLNGEVSVISGTSKTVKPFLSSFTPGTAADMTEAATFEAILVPQTIAAGALTVTFSVCEKNYYWSNPDDITLQPGQTVNLPISVSSSPEPSDNINGHKYVEMGDGLKWATCNVGATNPHIKGEHFFWGAVDETTYSIWYTYKYNPSGDCHTHTRYNESDGLRTLLPEDDAATDNWGAPWRTPTIEECNVLRDTDKFTWEVVQNYCGIGYPVCIITSKIPGYEGNRIILPQIGKVQCVLGGFSYVYAYWSASTLPNDPGGAYMIDGTSFGRYVECHIRPVAD